MNSNEIKNHRQHLGLRKIDEFANGIRGIRDIIWDRKKIVIQQLHETRQLAQDLNIDNIDNIDNIYSEK
jgi:hypothetical protein